ncbi:MULTISPECIES: sigma-70 family RNA polymerase sigma factor [unclassified Paraburkholderia]|uniref:sigma-70 family RNA polymerase sigma factor n=1 Tax=unclassified Paraburkholderia TaxID=2615204 RepID=UPI002AB035DF|nr:MULTISPECIES: sigma-70 family RNA polymerase sigma factor [unclassified Paraburkholderia]
MSAVMIDAQQQVHALYRDHHGWLHGWLRRKLGDAFEAADLAHDTFLRILSAHERLGAPELREPRAYLTTVARRVLINHYRRLSLEQAFLDALASLPEPQVPSTEERLVILETLHEVDTMLDSLAPKVRMAFLLAQLEGLTYVEIAERLQVSERTIKRYMADAFEACLMMVL